MAGYGYVQPSYGYLKAPRVQPVTPQRSLALAAAGTPTAANPYGLSSSAAAPAGSAPTGPTQNPYANITIASTPAKPAGSGSDVNAAAAQSSAASASAAPAAPSYDINTDPVLQSQNTLAGLSDEQAQAAALKQKQDALLNYGDPELILKTLGDNTLAQAASRNPTSTVAQYAQQRDKGLHDLTEALNGQNLLYSGYRVNQEQQAANDYQNALASAAANVNQGLGSIDSSLASTLGANQRQRQQSLSDAAARAIAAAAGGAGGSTGGGSTDTSGGGSGNTDPNSGGSLLGIDPVTGVDLGVAGPKNPYAPPTPTQNPFANIMIAASKKKPQGGVAWNGGQG